MITHPDLRHFPSTDPTTLSKKDKERERIARQTEEYLKANKIKEVDHTANKTWGQPIKLTRKEQVETMKRKLPRHPSEIKE